MGREEQRGHSRDGEGIEPGLHWMDRAHSLSGTGSEGTGSWSGWMGLKGSTGRGCDTALHRMGERCDRKFGKVMLIS